MNSEMAIKSARKFNAFYMCCIASAIGFVAVAPQTAHAQEQACEELSVTLLGTGTPLNDPKRFSSAALVQGGGLNLMVDAGRGASIRLGQLKIPLGKVDGIFLTHFHSDHTVGLGDVFATGYIPVPTLGGRKAPLSLYGPKGTAQLAEAIRQVYALDIQTRTSDAEVQEDWTKIDSYETGEGVAFEKNGMKVTVFPVNHGENIDPAVGYRFDCGEYSVVFAGDTKYDENVINNSKDVDLLVHPAAAAPQETMENPVVQVILNHHTSPEDAGRVFTQAAPKLAVLTHVVRLFGPNGQTTMQEVVQRTRETYDGPLVVGEDLMQFHIGPKGITTMLIDR